MWGNLTAGEHEYSMSSDFGFTLSLESWRTSRAWGASSCKRRGPLRYRQTFVIDGGGPVPASLETADGRSFTIKGQRTRRV